MLLSPVKLDDLPKVGWVNAEHRRHGNDIASEDDKSFGILGAGAGIDEEGFLFPIHDAVHADTPKTGSIDPLGILPSAASNSQGLGESPSPAEGKAVSGRPFHHANDPADIATNIHGAGRGQRKEAEESQHRL